MLTEEMKAEYADNLLIMMEDGKDTDAVRNKVVKYLEQLQQQGCSVDDISEILNHVSEEYGCSALDACFDLRMTKCEKIFLGYAAMPQTRKNWSVLFGKAIVAGMQQKRGSDFSPIFIEHEKNPTTIFKDLEEFLDLAKKEADRSHIVINQTFIIADDFHWRACHVQIIPGENKTQAQIKVIFVSSTSVSEPEDFDITFGKLSTDIFGAINTTLVFNTLPLQKDGASCRIIAVTLARMFHSLCYGKYKKAFPDFDLFANTVPNENIKTFSVGNVTFQLVDKLPSKVMQLDQYLRVASSTPGLPINSKGTDLGLEKHVYSESQIVDGETKTRNNRYPLLINKLLKRTGDFLLKHRLDTNYFDSIDEKFSIRDSINKLTTTSQALIIKNKIKMV
jgi:hypothetical protein